MDLPTLIAGPILRRVEPTTVTIWLAFSKKQSAQLIIWSGVKSNPIAASETQGLVAKSKIFETIQFAGSLHIAVITVDITTTRLAEATTYSYNIYFGESETPLNQDLGKAGLLDKQPEGSAENFCIGYKKNQLPSIILPGDKLENIHVVHGSCRKIHGVGDDAFRHLDKLIKDNLEVPVTRPQQLFLTGDQIYADEIPKLVLPYINALGGRLFNNVKEQLVITASSTPILNIPADMAHFPPGSRQSIQNEIAKFTASGTSSHLFSFQEFCATYLHYWSQDAWDPDLQTMLNGYKNSGYKDAVGKFHFYFLVNILRQVDTEIIKLTFPGSDEEVKKKVDFIKNLQTLFSTSAVPPVPEGWNVFSGIAGFQDVLKIMKVVESLDEDQEKILSSFYSLEGVLSESRASSDFLQALPYARRALANVPTYMIFDDHEMTDDWNFSQFWKNRVYTSSLGLQILRNGMMAYTIFQDWGNVPVEYPYELLKPAGDVTALENTYKNTFKRTKGNKVGLLKKIAEYGMALSAGTAPELPGATANAVDTFLLVGEAPADENFITPVRWHYDIPTGSAHTFFLDTRTRREYDNFIVAPGLLSQQAMDDQLPAEIADKNYAAVFVISPVPALALPVIEEFAQPLVGSIQGGTAAQGIGGAPVGAISGALQRDNEAWGFSEKHLEMFLERLALFKKVVILSGDIHYGCSTYADYWKERKQANHARIVQLVSSSVKNGWDLDFILLKSGFIQRIIGGFDFEFEKHGWKDKDLSVKGIMAPRHRMRLRRNPILLPRQGWHPGTKTDPEEPDWVWRLRISVDETNYEDIDGFPLKINKDLTEESVTGIQADIENTVLQMSDRHNSLLKLGRSRRIVWQPHMGHIFFTKTTDATPRYVVNHAFQYTCRSDGFLNSDTAPDFSPGTVLTGPFTIHKINLDVDADELKPPETFNKIPIPNPTV